MRAAKIQRTRELLGNGARIVMGEFVIEPWEVFLVNSGVRAIFLRHFAVPASAP